MQLSDFLDAGITTAVGVLGTDTVTRSQARLNVLQLVLEQINTIHTRIVASVWLSARLA